MQDQNTAAVWRLQGRNHGQVRGEGGTAPGGGTDLNELGIWEHVDISGIIVQGRTRLQGRSCAQTETWCG